MPSLKKNFFYSALLTVANYVFPLITYPYVSRVLGVTGIGICNFVDNIVNWFIVFSTMGIFVIGVREIAAVRSGAQERSEVFSSLLALNGLMTLAAAMVLTLAIFIVPKLAAYRTLLFLGVAKLVAHSLSLEWFFRGVEEFKYITNRSIIIKTLYVVAVFLFVRQADDYGVYYLLLTLAVVANTLVNVRYARRYVSFSLKDVDLKRFAAPFFILGLNYILTSFYSTMNVIYLGFVQGAEQVGYYTSATKILTIVTALISAFTTVMLPRMSAVLTDGKLDEFRTYVHNAFRLLFLVGIPGVFLLLTLSPDIVRVISGAGYEGAVVPMRIVAPMLIISGLDQILIMQFMMPRKEDRRILINSAIGAVVGIVLNLALVRTMGAKGSSIVWLCAEMAVCIAAMIAVFGKDKEVFPGKSVLKMVLLYLPLLLVLYGIGTVSKGNSFIRLVVAGLVTFLYFAVVSCGILKEPLVMGLIPHQKVSNRH